MALYNTNITLISQYPTTIPHCFCFLVTVVHVISCNTPHQAGGAAGSLGVQTIQSSCFLSVDSSRQFKYIYLENPNPKKYWSMASVMFFLGDVRQMNRFDRMEEE